MRMECCVHTIYNGIPHENVAPRAWKQRRERANSLSHRMDFSQLHQGPFSPLTLNIPHPTIYIYTCSSISCAASMSMIDHGIGSAMVECFAGCHEGV